MERRGINDVILSRVADGVDFLTQLFLRSHLPWQSRGGFGQKGPLVRES